MKRPAQPLEILPWQDPAQSPIPQLREGELEAVYYGQRSSGDFYDFIRCSPDRVLFGLFDIAGKLEQARPIMVDMQKTLRELAAELLDENSTNEMESMAELWIRLNREVIRSAQGVHQCAAFIGCYNEELNTISYVNSGHTPGLVRDGDEVEELAATALPLGLFSQAVPDPAMVALESRNQMLLVSRGVVEARRRSEEFGIQGAKQYLQAAGSQTARELSVGMLARVQQFMGTAPTHNDVTALSLVRST